MTNEARSVTPATSSSAPSPNGETDMNDIEDDYDEPCEDRDIEHLWSEWEIGPYFPREERFCSRCGGMDTQEIR